MSIKRLLTAIARWVFWIYIIHIYVFILVAYDGWRPVLLYLVAVMLFLFVFIIIMPIIVPIIRTAFYLGFRKQIHRELGLDNTAYRYGIKEHYAEKVLSYSWKDIEKKVGWKSLSSLNCLHSFQDVIGRFHLACKFYRLSDRGIEPHIYEAEREIKIYEKREKETNENWYKSFDKKQRRQIRSNMPSWGRILLDKAFLYFTGK